MRRTYRRLSWLWIAFLLASCASAEKFAKRSELELRQGDPDKAYRTAIIAVKRDPGLPRAIAALNAAASARSVAWKQSIRALAVGDTLAAARQALQLEAFRREVATHGGALEPDVEFAEFEHRVRVAAAGILSGEAADELDAGRAKQAYAHLVAARDYAPNAPDIDRRVDEAYAQAVQRVAILPIENQTGVPDLSGPIADQVWAGVQRRIGWLRFTQLVGPERARERMTLSERDELSREQAIRLGRRMGADRVVWGRIYASHTDTDNHSYHDVIYRKRAQRDTSGHTHDAYVPVDFDAVSRERRVTVSWELEVLDVDDEESVSRRASTVAAAARTVYTRFQPDGDCDDYCLVSPALRSSDSRRAGEADERWRDTFGKWALSDLLETSRRENRSGFHFSDKRGQFHRDTRELPVYFDGLPDEQELLLLALDELWRPVIETLEEQDDR